MSMAFEISPDDVRTVLQQHREMLRHPAQNISAVADQVFDDIDPDRVERAALISGIDLDDQTAGAYSEIKTILVEMGVLESPRVFH